LSGKSSLLIRIGHLAARVHPTIVFVYLKLQPDDDMRPSDKIAESVGCTYPATMVHAGDRVEYLQQFLMAAGQFVFFVVDDFHLAFSALVPRGKLFVADMFALGSGCGGHVFAIISGCSDVLRQLCFATLPTSKRVQFPHYDPAVDMNSTKYVPMWIFPLIRAEDVRGFAKTVVKNNHFTDDVLTTALLASRGVPGKLWEQLNCTLAQCARHSVMDDWSVSDVSLLEKAVITSLCSFLATTQKMDLASPLENACAWCARVPSKCILPYSDFPTFFSLCDKGLLIYDADAQTVALGNPSVYFTFHADEKAGWLSVQKKEKDV
jgi:hypothetical protein